MFSYMWTFEKKTIITLQEITNNVAYGDDMLMIQPDSLLLLSSFLLDGLAGPMIIYDDVALASN